MLIGSIPSGVIAVGQICLKFGRFRLQFGRRLEGGLCPPNVVSNDWKIIPSADARKSEDQSASLLDFSPSKVLGTLFAKILKLLTKRGVHGRLL
jgi:hypothetical protein